MTLHASGSFDVKLNPQKPNSEIAQAANLGRMTIDKQFHGDLGATSKREMISARTETEGSAGYVAMERVTGTLKGRRGSFVLQHSATMSRGVPALSITVVPDSGTGDLKGITGKMNIMIAPDGKHSYEFDYTIECVAQDHKTLQEAQSGKGPGDANLANAADFQHAKVLHEKRSCSRFSAGQQEVRIFSPAAIPRVLIAGTIKVHEFESRPPIPSSFFT